MIAGPNASGKTTLTRHLRSRGLRFGYYVNADDLEAELSITGNLYFGRYQLTVDTPAFTSFFTAHPLCPPSSTGQIEIDNNILYADQPTVSGYFAAILADFIRQQLLMAGFSFSFETVMSSADKINLLRTAKEKGYRTYLYYICTNDAQINKVRAARRKESGGHHVPEEKITPRYDRSLDLLLDAINVSDRAYLFDNSDTSHILIAEVTGGKTIELKTHEIPEWFTKAVYEKITPQEN
jgi:predicted ABC-type ATPase